MNSKWRTLWIVPILAFVWLAGLATGWMFPSASWGLTNKGVPLWITDPAERASMAVAIKEHDALQAQGVYWLALATREIYRALYRYEPWHNDDAARVRTLKMMFEVWLKMPAPPDDCPGRRVATHDADGHQVCLREP